MGTMVFSAMVGIANCSIYMTTIDYMVCAYGPYAASATGGNGFARDILAGILTIPATPFFESMSYHNLPVVHYLTETADIGGDRHLEYASTILFCISVVLVVSVYAIYWYGPALRKRSPFAQQLSSSQMEGYSHSRRASAIMPRSKLGSRRNSLTYH
ncbi:hypothetical protein V1507DRAFT_119559 [Lipomyces tetrasporus]